MQFKVAPFQRLIDHTLADQHTRSEEDGFKRDNPSKQRKRLFIEGLVRQIEIEDDPTYYERALKSDELDRPDEPPYPMEEAMVDC